MSKILDPEIPRKDSRDHIYTAKSYWTRFLSPYGQGHILIDSREVNGIWNSNKSIEISLKSGRLVNVSGTLDGVAQHLGIKVPIYVSSASASESEKE